MRIRATKNDDLNRHHTGRERKKLLLCKLVRGKNRQQLGWVPNIIMPPKLQPNPTNQNQFSRSTDGRKRFKGRRRRYFVAWAKKVGLKGKVPSMSIFDSICDSYRILRVKGHAPQQRQLLVCIYNLWEQQCEVLARLPPAAPQMDKQSLQLKCIIQPMISDLSRWVLPKKTLSNGSKCTYLRT